MTLPERGCSVARAVARLPGVQARPIALHRLLVQIEDAGDAAAAAAIFQRRLCRRHRHRVVRHQLGMANGAARGFAHRVLLIMYYSRKACMAEAKTFEQGSDVGHSAVKFVPAEQVFQGEPR